MCIIYSCSFIYFLEITNYITSKYLLQVQPIETSCVRTLRSGALNNFEGVKLNAAQQPPARLQQEVLENQQDVELAITNGDT